MLIFLLSPLPAVSLLPFLIVPLFLALVPKGYLYNPHMAQHEQSIKLGPLEFWDGISCTEIDPGEAGFQMSFLSTML